MARAAAAASVLCAPAVGFAPHGSLRAQPAEPLQRVSAEARLSAPAAAAPGGSSWGAVAGGSLAAIGLTFAAAQASGRCGRGASRVERRVVGICPPLSEKFDPLNLGSTDQKMERYTAVEIKHGRVAMIACVGYVMPEVFRFPGCENFGSGLKALSTIPPEGIFQLLLFIGAHEFGVKPREGGMGSWDFGLGTELIEGIPEEELERRQTVERNNGRLAMIGIMGLMVQDGMFGKNPIALLKSDGFWGPAVDRYIQYIPICRGDVNGSEFCAIKPATRGPGLTAMRALPKWGQEERMSPAVPFLKYPEVLDGWVGGEKGFDPLGVTDALPVYLCREAELKHGRVCMLATIGWIATDCGWRFPGEIFQKVSTVEAHDAMVKAGIMGPFLATVGVYEIYGGWLCLQGFEGNIKREAGDFFFGKNFLPKDEEQANVMRLKELENGRLAMLAFSGICTQSVLTGKPWPFF